MEYTWSRAFADGREAALMGGSAERLLDACRRLSSAGAKTASGLVEAPLLGVPEYDALVIHNPRGLLSGCLSDGADTSDTAVQDFGRELTLADARKFCILGSLRERVLALLIRGLADVVDKVPNLPTNAALRSTERGVVQAAHSLDNAMIYSRIRCGTHKHVAP